MWCSFTSSCIFYSAPIASASFRAILRTIRYENQYHLIVSKYPEAFGEKSHKMELVVLVFEWISVFGLCIPICSRIFPREVKRDCSLLRLWDETKRWRRIISRERGKDLNGLLRVDQARNESEREGKTGLWRDDDLMSGLARIKERTKECQEENEQFTFLYLSEWSFLVRKRVRICMSNTMIGERRMAGLWKKKHKRT